MFTIPAHKNVVAPAGQIVNPVGKTIGQMAADGELSVVCTTCHGSQTDGFVAPKPGTMYRLCRSCGGSGFRSEYYSAMKSHFASLRS
jgi:hypothetical protein